MEVNGKTYPLWGQFVEKQEEWIGGTLRDSGDDMDREILGADPMTTKIKGIELKPNGDDSAFFSVLGEDFDCGFDVGYGGIGGGNPDDEWMTFSGYGGHTWKIKKPE